MLIRAEKYFAMASKCLPLHWRLKIDDFEQKVENEYLFKLAHRISRFLKKRPLQWFLHVCDMLQQVPFNIGVDSCKKILCNGFKVFTPSPEIEN